MENENIKLVSAEGLIESGVFPADRTPKLRTIREWTRMKAIPSHRMGGFVYYNPAEVLDHIVTKRKVAAR